MDQQDRPIVIRLAHAIWSRMTVLGSFTEVQRRYRVTEFLLSDAMYRIPKRPDWNFEQVLEWTRGFIEHWKASPVPSTPPHLQDGTASEANPKLDFFVGDMGTPPAELPLYGPMSNAYDGGVVDDVDEDVSEDDEKSDEDKRRSSLPKLLPSTSFRRESRGIAKLAKVLIIENDPHVARDYGLSLAALGFDVFYAFDAESGVRAVEESDYDVVVIDIRMPNKPLYDDFLSVGGDKTGLLVSHDITDRAEPNVIVALSNSTHSEDVAWFQARGHHYCAKRDFSPDRFARFIAVNVTKRFEYLKCFIVHGHDMDAVSELSGLLQSRLGFKEPIVLKRVASLGRTIIEKFEFHASTSDLVFALFTPDDLPGTEGGDPRARQNVINEVGYFYSELGRASGRVILLHKHGVEQPSDYQGIVSIDITNGIESAWDEIMTELQAIFGPP